MKIHGKKVEAPKEQIIVIPRKTGNLVIRAQAVLSFSDFEKINPKPLPPEIIRPGGIKSFDVNDRDYVKKLDDWAESRTNWMFLKSLEATEGLEWETVDMNNPKTWGNLGTELESAGFSALEVSKIFECVLMACGLDQQKIDEATSLFLADQAAMLEKEGSPSIEPSGTQLGELVKDLGLDPKA